MYKTSVAAVVLFSLIALINAQCSCQSKPPLDIQYTGEACQCSRQLPIQIETPKITEHRDAHYDYGFTIQRPQQAPAEIKYTFDFHMEKPKPLPSASLATYAFEVQEPVQKPAAEPQRYSFDYQIQTPVAQRDPSNLEGLMAHVDKIVLQRQDCQDKNSCQCGSYKPTIDLLQRCPRHGHLYQNGGPLNPNQQRYNTDFQSIEQPNLAPTSSDRSKRNVVAPLPLKFRGYFSGPRSNNEVPKTPEPVVDRNQDRIDRIIKQNFGEDPTENIDELLRPKPFGSRQKIDAEPKKAEEPKEPKEVESTPEETDEFFSKIKPQMDRAKVNFRNRITKIVNKARLEALRAKHMMKQKRSIESVSSDDGNFEAENFEILEPIYITDVSVENQGTENEIEREFVSDDDGTPTSSSDRIRKHCDRCGQLANKFPCVSCGAVPHETSSRNVRMNQENPTRYAPEYQAQPFYMFDHSTPATDDVTVGSFHNQQAYGELQDILSKNSDALHRQNHGIGDDHLVQPMDFEHATSAIRFIQELTQRSNSEDNNSHDFGSRKQNFHSKRSFKIVPLAEKDDGSVFVKISPLPKSPKWNVEPKVNEKSKSQKEGKMTQMASKIINENDNFGNGNQGTNFEKFSRNGKKYEILALDRHADGSTGSVEDLEILKYIYEVNQKGHAKDDASNDNRLTNTHPHVDS